MELETNVRCVSRRAQWLSAAALLLSIALIPVAPFLLFPLLWNNVTIAPQTVSLITVVALIVLAVIASSVRGRLYAPRKRALRVDDRGVSVDGALVAPKAAIKVGCVLIRGSHVGNSTSYVELRGKTLLRFDVASDAQGHQALRTLDHDVSQRAVTFAAGSVSKARFAIPLGLVVGPIIVALVRLPGAVVLAVAAALAFVALGRQLVVWRGKVDVGVDGVLLRRPGSKLYVGWNQVAIVHQTGSGARLELKDGRSINVRTHAPMPVDSNDQVSEPVALFERMSAAHDAYESPTAEPTEERLARKGRSLDDWSDELRRLGSSFRNAAISSDDLEKVIGDAGARPSARAAAAYTLRRADGDRKGRIRVAAQACAEPRLRIALERLAAADKDADLRDALAEVDAQSEDDAIRARRNEARRNSPATE